MGKFIKICWGSLEDDTHITPQHSLREGDAIFLPVEVTKVIEEGKFGDRIVVLEEIVGKKNLKDTISQKQFKTYPLYERFAKAILDETEFSTTLMSLESTATLHRPGLLKLLKKKKRE